jgi:hypothetical protein
MRRSTALLIGALLAHAAGWLAPVVDGYVGWQAFRAALSPVWPFEHFTVPTWRLIVLAVASAATNALFAGSAIAMAAGALERALARRALVAALLVATLVNLHWPISMGDHRADLRVGYYVWVASFLLLALSAGAWPARPTARQPH